MKDYNYFSFLPIDSYNAPFNYIETLRDRGKTYAKLHRTCRRFLERGEGAIFLRRLEEEAKGDAQQILRSEKTRACISSAGIDPDTLRVNAGRVEMKRGKVWCPFIRIGHLSGAGKFRGSDDSRETRIYLDEGACPVGRRSAYRGNEVEDFLDIVKSCRRDDSPIKAYILANKEAYISPYLSYMGIPQIPPGWSGIRVYKGGGWAVQSDLTPPPHRGTDDSEKFKAALAGTAYGAYLAGESARAAADVRIAKTPTGARHYMQADFGEPLTASVYRGAVYFRRGIDRTRGILVPAVTAKYKNARVYSTRYRRDFSVLITAKKLNAIYSADLPTAEAVADLLQKMGI